MVDFRMLADNIPVLHCPSGTDVEISKENSWFLIKIKSLSEWHQGFWKICACLMNYTECATAEREMFLLVITIDFLETVLKLYQLIHVVIQWPNLVIHLYDMKRYSYSCIDH